MQPAGMQVNIVDTNGPLFVPQATEEVTRFFAACYPQFAKRCVGWQLSVEELHLLLRLARQQCASSTGPLAEAARTEVPELTVTFASSSAAEQYEALQSTYATDCAVYACVTRHHGYRLRHGSAFGASFIGYRDLHQHGECLFFMGPLSGLEVTRAVRVARSVGKDAVMVTLVSGGDAVTVTPLGAQGAREAGQPRKLQRLE